MDSFQLPPTPHPNPPPPGTPACSKGGNNNTYCHDSALNYLDWQRALADDDGLLRFTRHVIALRRVTGGALLAADCLAGLGLACTIGAGHSWAVHPLTPCGRRPAWLALTRQRARSPPPLPLAGRRTRSCAAPSGSTTRRCAALAQLRSRGAVLRRAWIAYRMHVCLALLLPHPPPSTPAELLRPVRSSGTAWCPTSPTGRRPRASWPTP